MKFQNTTGLDSDHLERAILRAIEGWPHNRLDVRVRYSRGADFSGTCYYTQGRIFVNLGRNNQYPYLLDTNIARPQSNSRYWWRESYSVEVADAEQLVLFVFLHEFYHWLIKKARRNMRQKEGRCDRFATRGLVDGYGAAVRDEAGKAVERASWDFQDLDGFVAAARGTPRQPRQASARPAARQPSRPTGSPKLGEQLLLFKL